jgi:hypothetical protein
LPTTYSWYLVGERLSIPYEATQGRRVNAIGAYFTHGPEAGKFEFDTRVSLPQSRAKTPRTTPAVIAAKHGVELHEVGTIDSECFLAFVWRIAGRPVDAPIDWRREIPLHIVLDNYSVHKSQVVKDALEALEAANVHLFYLPSYSPELSDIEPVWKDVKHHRMTTRSFALAGGLKRGVDSALLDKAEQLRRAHP